MFGEDGRARPVRAATDPLLRDYYDTEWGMPVRDERGVFERLSLEAFQSGLSWRTILVKRPAFRGPSPTSGRRRWRASGTATWPGCRPTPGSCAIGRRSWPPSPESETLARRLKRRGFRFVGPTTVFALMEAIGIVDTHLVDSWRRGSSGVWA